MKRRLCLLSIATSLVLGVGCEQHPLPQAKDQVKPKESAKETPAPEPTPEASPAPQFFPDR
ncbi:MAG: hypothetical protein WEB60_06205 [Terrimicrobiaceae bacterium]